MIDLTDCMVYAVAFVREWDNPDHRDKNDEWRALRAHQEALALMQLRKSVANIPPDPTEL